MNLRKVSGATLAMRVARGQKVSTNEFFICLWEEPGRKKPGSAFQADLATPKNGSAGNLMAHGSAITRPRQQSSRHTAERKSVRSRGFQSVGSNRNPSWEATLSSLACAFQCKQGRANSLRELLPRLVEICYGGYAERNAMRGFALPCRCEQPAT